MKHLIIIVKQRDCAKPRLYKTTSFEEIPSPRQLQGIGVDYRKTRKDKLIIEEVSADLYNVFHGTWVRP